MYQAMDKKKLNILTRCTRLQNLLEVRQSIFNHLEKSPHSKCIDLYWYILFDTSFLSQIPTDILNFSKDKRIKFRFSKGQPQDLGHNLINECINDDIESGWVYVLDDDTVMHQDFIDSIYEAISNNKDIGGIFFHQKVDGKDFTKKDIRYATPDSVKVSKIDFGQFILKREIISDTKLVSGTYVADGIFIEEIYNKNDKSQFLFLDKILSYYNFLSDNKNESDFFLPRILIVGDNIPKTLTSQYLSDWESTDLKCLHICDDKNIEILLSEFNPDSIVTSVENFDIYENLNSLPYEIRRRWINIDPNHTDAHIGQQSYSCSKNFILNPPDHTSGNKTNPLVSFFTPFYNTGKKLKKAYESLKNQTYSNWEWVLVNDSDEESNETLNIANDMSKNDPRVKVFDIYPRTKGIIGESKYRSACLCSGAYLAELDHDDYLLPDACLYIVKAFDKYKECKFVYSDCAEIYDNNESLTYGNGFAFGYGKYRDEEHRGIVYKTCITPNINPKTIRHIVGVPNHIRVWEREFYHSIGGHNRRLSIADDYEIIVRTFLNTKMLHIPKLLYLQFYHSSNTQDKRRSDIQRRVRTISDFYCMDINKRFKDLGLKDWAYDENNLNPLLSCSVFGPEEQVANLTYGI